MWYTASLFFEGEHLLEPKLESLWEEVILLVEADDEEQARAIAQDIGRAREHEYSVSDPVPHTLRWRFRRIERLCEIEAEELSSGVEVFSLLTLPARERGEESPHTF